ncbi:MAG: esterase-like activity of phytase family protein [Maricaulaceae bacterium]|jgi:hypothetical protein
MRRLSCACSVLAAAAALAGAGCATAPSGAAAQPLDQVADAGATAPRLRPEPPTNLPPLEPAVGACEPAPITSPQASFGELMFLRGFELLPNTGDFGGLSGLIAAQPLGLGVYADEPDFFIALTDSGRLATLSLRALQTDPQIECGLLSIADPSGAPLPGQHADDSEGLARLPSGGWLVSFEREHRMSALVGGEAPREATIYTFDNHGLEDNQSLEALTVLADGQILAGAETPSILGRPHPVWRLPPVNEDDLASAAAGAPAREAPRSPTFRIADPNGYALVGMDTTARGNLITLHRFYTDRTGVRIRVGFLPRDVAEGGTGVQDVAEIAAFDQDSPIPIDNFEGVATRPGADGLTEIWIVSDNNFSQSQKTLLYGFTFDEAAFEAGHQR